MACLNALPLELLIVIARFVVNDDVRYLLRLRLLCRHMRAFLDECAEMQYEIRIRRVGVCPSVGVAEMDLAQRNAALTVYENALCAGLRYSEPEELYGGFGTQHVYETGGILLVVEELQEASRVLLWRLESTAHGLQRQVYPSRNLPPYMSEFMAEMTNSKLITVLLDVDNDLVVYVVGDNFRSEDTSAHCHIWLRAVN